MPPEEGPQASHVHSKSVFHDTKSLSEALSTAGVLLLLPPPLLLGGCLGADQVTRSVYTACESVQRGKSFSSATARAAASSFR